MQITQIKVKSGGPSVLIGYGVRAARDLLDRKELGALVIPGGST